MGAQGTTTIDFGAFPGSSDASVTVTGQGSIAAFPTSVAEAYLYPSATADHSADEHMVESIKVFAHTIVAATGFTITALNTSQVNEPLDKERNDPNHALAAAQFGANRQGSVGGTGTRIYGLWTVVWVWN